MRRGRAGAQAGETPAGAGRAGPLGDIARPLESAGRVLATLALLSLLAFAASLVFLFAGGYADRPLHQVDFVAFWAAAKLALAGDAALAFDHEVLREVQALPGELEATNHYWLYPPGLQLAPAPLGLMPYWAAWLTFGVVSLVTFARVQWHLAEPVPMGRHLLLGAPVVVLTLQLGQLLLLWAAALVMALRAMAAGRAVLAGLMLGLLSLKPQLGILVPVALVAARRWDVILWALAATIAVHALPTLVVGLEYWEAFFRRLGEMSGQLEHGTLRLHLMTSPYALGRALGLAHDPALAVHGVVALGLAILVYRVWRRPGAAADPGLAAGVLCAAVPLATPYAYHYELVFAVPAAILMVRGGFGRAAVDRGLLGLALLAPAAFWVFPAAAPFSAPVLLALVLRAAHLARSPQAAPEAPQGAA